MLLGCPALRASRESPRVRVHVLQRRRVVLQEWPQVTRRETIWLPPEATTRRWCLPSTRPGCCSKNYAPRASHGDLRAFLLRLLGGVAARHERCRKVHAGKVRPVKSVSRRIATPISAPLNFAPFTFASLRFTFRKCARWKIALERSQRKNSTPLACASVKSAPGRIASVMSVFRRSAFRRFAPDKSASGSLALRKSEPSQFAPRRIAPLRLIPCKSAFERSAPAKSARAPPSFPRKKSACASRISASRLPLC